MKLLKHKEKIFIKVFLKIKELKINKSFLKYKELKINKSFLNVKNKIIEIDKTQKREIF